MTARRGAGLFHPPAAFPVEAALTGIAPDTVLQRAPHLILRLAGPATIEIVVDGQRVPVGVHALAILDAFAQPTAVRDALTRLEPLAAGTEDWIELTSSIAQLHRIGALHGGRTSSLVGAGWDAVPPHVDLLNDRSRTTCFLDAIAAVVRPGDVVVDIGTGTGLLAVAAARAGAANVYAVESSTLANKAEAVAAANDVADRVTVVRGWSTQIDLPRRADVLITETVGSDPLTEGILETVADARRRLLRPDARVIPGRLRVCAQVLEVDPAKIERHTFAPRVLARWRDWYRVDLDALAAAEGEPVMIQVDPAAARRWRPLAAPVVLADLALAGSPPTALDASAEVAATTTGRLNGLLIYFELEVAAGLRLTTAPAEVASDNHWAIPLWLFGAAPKVAPGDGLRIAYRYRTGGGRPALSRLSGHEGS